MKKAFNIVALFLAVSMSIAVFTSCNQQVTEEETTLTTELTEATEAESEVTTEEETEETTEKVKGTLTVSVGDDLDYIPYKYKSNGSLTGINVSIMNKLAEKLDMNIVFTESDALDSQASDEKPDVIINQINSDTLDVSGAVFSKTYMSDIQSVIVKAASEYMVYDDFYSGFDASGYPTGLKDGVKIGVKKGTTGDRFASAPFTEWGFSSENIVEFETTEALINALSNDEITAVITDDAIAKKAVDNTSGLKILDSSFYSADYQIAVVSEDEDIKTEILTAINELIDDGTVQSIIDEYMN